MIFYSIMKKEYLLSTRFYGCLVPISGVFERVKASFGVIYPLPKLPIRNNIILNIKSKQLHTKRYALSKSRNNRHCRLI